MEDDHTELLPLNERTNDVNLPQANVKHVSDAKSTSHFELSCEDQTNLKNNSAHTINKENNNTVGIETTKPE